MVEIKGFAELQAKIKQLPDKIKKREMLKVLGQVANATVSTARKEAPKSKKRHQSALDRHDPRCFACLERLEESQKRISKECAGQKRGQNFCPRGD